MIPVIWKTKIPLVANDKGELYYSTQNMQDKKYCDVVKHGLPYDWSSIDEKLEKDYLTQQGIPIEVIIDQNPKETSEYDNQIIKQTKYGYHSFEILQEKYNDIIDEQYIMKRNHNLLNPFNMHQKYCKPSLKQALRSRKPRHKQHRSKKQNSRLNYDARKEKVATEQFIEEDPYEGFNPYDNDGYSDCESTDKTISDDESKKSYWYTYDSEFDEGDPWGDVEYYNYDHYTEYD